MRLGPISRVLAPSYSWCQKCGTPWKFVKGHVVDYEFVNITLPDGEVIKDFPRMGHFALCEDCWDESDTNERVQFHLQSLGRWCDSDEQKAALVVKAVRGEGVSKAGPDS